MPRIGDTKMVPALTESLVLGEGTKYVHEQKIAAKIYWEINTLPQHNIIHKFLPKFLAHQSVLWILALLCRSPWSSEKFP